MKTMKNADTVRITPEIEGVVRQAVTVALRFEELTGRKLGISANVGEILVAKKLGLRLVRSDIEQGYDAIDGSKRRVQIKVRRSEGGRGRNVPTQKSPTSKFSVHPYDYALLCILTRNYKLHEIHKASRISIEKALKGKRKRVLSIGKFRKIGERLYP